LKRKKNILVITYWPLDNALISTYTLPYVRIMLQTLPAESRIWLMTLSGKKFRSTSAFQTITQALRAERIECLDFEYSPFGFRMLFRGLRILGSLILVCRKQNIGCIHAWCTPAGAIGYALSVITRRPLVLDSFEPHAETMVETGTWTKRSLAYRILIWLEKKQARKASHIICAAPGMMQYAQRTYGVERPEEFVKPACVDLQLFKPCPKARTGLNGAGEKDIICVYAGKFGGIYLEHETFDFFATAAKYWNGRFKVLLLTSHTEAEICAYCSMSGFDRKDILLHFVPHEQVPGFICQADFAICPVKPIPTKKYCSPIKDGEYWACGLPVVITSGISNDSDIIAQNDAGYVLGSLDTAEYFLAAASIDKILQEKEHQQRIRKLAEKFRNYEIAENIYRTIYA
jgi:glycosyltransferase involved in cell wall biosynthesis